MKNKSIFTKKLIAKQTIAATNDYQVNPNHENLKKMVYWNIRFLPCFKKDDDVIIEKKFLLISYVKDDLKKLTYREFINLFPIAKEYDGAKWGMKDYYSTMEYLNDKSLDDYIEDPLELILEYYNWNIIEFGVEFMSVTSDMHKIQTGIGITEAFMFPDQYPTDSKGNLIGVTSDGKVHKVASPRKSKPKLAVVK